MTPVVVLDINVVLDLWHFQDPRTQHLDQVLEARALRVMTCEALNLELEDVLSRNAFAATRPTVLQKWRGLSELRPLHQRAPWHCRDQDDQKLLDLAVSTSACALLTRDKALLALAARAAQCELQIVVPEHFDFSSMRPTSLPH